jgi:hypothetical protein
MGIILVYQYKTAFGTELKIMYPKFASNKN